LSKAAALLFAAAVLASAAGPLDFARAELDEAISERKLSPARFVVRTEYSLAQPEEGFQISTLNLIRAGSQRGLVYGLLEAAHQVRNQGRLSAVTGKANVPLRGVRRTMAEEDWGRPREWWLDRFAQLARLRLNRFHLMLADEPLTEERIEALKGISDAARDRAIDLVIGLEDPSAEEVMRLLAECEAVRGVHVDPETAAFASGPVSTAGRYVVLETTEVVKTAVPVPMRVAVEAGEAVPVCEGPCSTYTVFEAGARAPAKVAGSGFELLGEAGAGWVALGYTVARPRRRRRGGGLFAKSKRVI
jgi:hypothetical protein